MPLPSMHPSLPQNPTTVIGSSSSASASASPAAIFGRAVGSSAITASPAGGGGSVNRETLKGLQDVEWSDDEDDPDCMVCAEPLDLSDQNFKPCPCGLGICQFCYNRLLREDPRCPGCRRRYDRENVVFQPVDFEEVKKAKDRKAKRAKTIKQLTSMGRRNLLGTRVVMKNTVYVTGMQLPASTPEESVSILRTHEYFGQYGKIAKIYIRDRSSSSYDDPASAHGIYIVYTRREDAARAIAAINSMPSPTSPTASYGTTRYCDAFLRGMKCDNSSCTNLHEWGGESDCFSKDDYEVALTRPAEYDARQKQAAAVAPPPLTIKSHWPKPNAEDAGSSALPNSAGWGKNISVKTVPANKASGVNGTKSLKIGNMVSLKSNSAFPPPSPSALPTPIGSARAEKKSAAAKATASAMARGKSSDSTQSTNPPSSAQPSPRKKPISLSSSTTIPTLSSLSGASASTTTATPTTAPPPGLGVAPPPGLGKPVATPAPVPAPIAMPVPATTEIADDSMPEESTSAESEAGPSSNSPTPQTPVQSTDTTLPAPLTSDPIFLHSPYEEPEIYNFPAMSDPDFEFVLGLDLAETQHGMTPFTPAPFSKTLVGLAELGVLSPDLLNLGTPSRGHRTFSSNFQPFDLASTMPEEDPKAPVAGPSRTRDTPARQHSHRGEDEAEPPRTTSRFDFARQSTHTPHSYSRGQSPFAMRTASAAGMAGGDWGAGPNSTRQQQQQQMFEEHFAAQAQQAQRQQQQHTGDSRGTGTTAAGALASFVGSYGSEWSQGQSQMQDLGSPARLDGRMSQLSIGRQHRNGNGGDDGYTDQGMYGPGPQRLFSPESSIHEDYHPQQPQQQQQQQYTPLHQNFYQQQQHQQARTHSPTPVSINPHSFRRY